MPDSTTDAGKIAELEKELEREKASAKAFEQRLSRVESIFQNLQGAGEVQVSGGVISYTGRDARSGAT